MTQVLGAASHRFPSRKLLSVGTHAYNEERNLPVLNRRLCAVQDLLEVDWEWIVSDDGSQDATFEGLSSIRADDRRVRDMGLSRNFGSRAALSCALSHAAEAPAVIIAVDLQYPPKATPTLVECCNQGARSKRSRAMAPR